MREHIGLLASIVGLLAAVISVVAVLNRPAPTVDPQAPVIQVPMTPAVGPPVIVRPIHRPHR